MYNNLEEVLDRVLDIMEARNCRMYDTDIILAIKKSTYEIHNNKIVSVSTDTSNLVKY